MILRHDAGEKELRDAAALEAWSTHAALEKGKLSVAQRVYFMAHLASAAVSIAEGLAPPIPKRTRKPRKKPDATS